ncbi:MAG: TIGR01244 family sulfur transferase [Tateyamaria sp.]|uniref:TIGR01244 family sulfur transferase n=1 Tax=Tateyamaria sp. TaxID=1929288 RepID=UPI0032825105
MNFNKITDTLTVSPQIHPDDMAAIKAAGFKTIVCNRPDGETEDQTSFAQIKAAATAEGLVAYNIPVTPQQISDEDVAKFGAALSQGPLPVLAYCRTGTRSAMLWAFHGAGGRSQSDILAATLAAGYDLTGVADRIANCGTAQTLATG